MRVAIVGAGGHGTVVADVLLRMRDAGSSVELAAFVDENPPEGVSHVLGAPVVRGGLTALSQIGYDSVIVAIGANTVRRARVEELHRRGVPLIVARHPASIVAASVHIGAGSVICAGAVVGPSARIGIGVIVNTHSSVDHHNDIGDYAHIAPGVRLGGAVTVGPDTLVGIGSVVLPGCAIGSRSIVGAGSVVTRSLPPGVLAFGTPARIQGVRRRPPNVAVSVREVASLA